MGAAESSDGDAKQNGFTRGCVTVSKTIPGMHDPNSDLLKDAPAPDRTTGGFLGFGASDLEYDLEMDWSEAGRAYGQKQTIVSIPRRDAKGQYFKTTQTFPKDHPKEDEEEELDAAEPAAPALTVSVMPFDWEALQAEVDAESAASHDITEARSRLEFVCMCEKGRFAEADSSSSLSKLADLLDIELADGKPVHSREYKNDNMDAGPHRPTLTRLGLQASDEFQGLWLVEAHRGIGPARMGQIYALLRRHSRALAFFQRSHVVLPLLGYSNSSSVTVDQVVHQALGWVYQCYREGPNVTNITFVTPTDRQADQVAELFKRESNLLLELTSRVYAEEENGLPSEIFDRTYVKELVEKLREWGDNARNYIDSKTEVTTVKEQRVMFTLKIMLHHVDLVLDGFDNRSSENQIIRIVTSAGHSVAQSFFAKRQDMQGYRDLSDLDAKLTYLKGALKAYDDFELYPDDRERILALFEIGDAAKNQDMSLYLNTVDVMYVLEHILNLLLVFQQPRGPLEQIKLPGNEEAQAELDAANKANQGIDAYSEQKALDEEEARRKAEEEEARKAAAANGDTNTTAAADGPGSGSGDGGDADDTVAPPRDPDAPRPETTDQQE